jgi:hypothetical protein
MLQYKSTNIIGELQIYFSSSEKAVTTLFQNLRSLKIYSTPFRTIDKCNTQYCGKHLFTLLLLFPFFTVKDVSHFNQTSVYQLYKCGKDVFYEFLKNSVINWRKLSYQITKQFIRKANSNSDKADTNPIRCLIADDTDLPKRGRCFELLSRIYSHVTHTYNYGFKGLFLCFHDGKSLFNLDFSLHGEKGDDPEKPYGLTKKQQKKRFKNKRRPKKSSSQQRVNEYFETKIDMLITMIRTAIVQDIRFDYLLTDSWFTCFKLIKFIVTRKIKCHFLGMVKSNKTKYNYKGKMLTINQIRDCLKHSKKARANKKLNCKFYEVEVDFKGISVKLFYCKMTKRSKWHCLLTTNLTLDFEQAFEIYATRWTIEVFFKECKQLLRLGKCEARSFEAQIAATTLCMLQYNQLSMVKRLEAYESLGALFRQTTAETIELTVKERIYLIIIEILTEISHKTEFELDFLIEHIYAEYQQFTNVKNPESLARAA